MRGFYKALDVFVLPSRSDCLAFVQVEAMLSGIPVVATDIPGARVPVKKTGMGELVRAQDPQNLARGIVQVLKKKNSYEKKRKLAEEMFDYGKTLKKYEEILL
jgi:glycosyltransferase involved in cell wall biosynthesis